MIRKSVLTILILLLSWNIFSEDIQKIPRRVYFIQESHEVTIDENLTGMISGISNFLYNSISSIIPIVRVYETERANSIIKVDIFGEEEFIKIIITLIEDDAELITRNFSYPRYREEYEGFSGFINTTALEFSEYLGFVLPKVEGTTDILEEEQYREAAEETIYLDSLAKKWELTLWTSGLMQLGSTKTGSGDFDTIRGFSMFPLIFDAARYFNRNVGLIYSFYFDKNDFFIFGEIYDNNGDPIGISQSDNLFLLNGLGFSYRTVSRVAAQFNIIQYAGAVRIEAITDMRNFLSAGEKSWILMMPLAFSSIINVNITPHFSIKTKITMYLNLSGFGEGNDNSYDSDYTTMFFQYFSLGASVRF